MKAAYKIILVGSAVALAVEALHAWAYRIHPLPTLWTWAPPIAVYLTAGYFAAVLLPKARWWIAAFFGGIIGFVDGTLGSRICYLVSGYKIPTGPKAPAWFVIAIIICIVAGFFASIGFATRKLTAHLVF